MSRIEELRRMLAEEYGISSDAELEAALKKAPRIDIFAMAGERNMTGRPEPRKTQSRNSDRRQVKVCEQR